jgi:N-methylhydantoinase A
MDVGVDVGGTFTDFVGFRGREIVTAKVPSTRDPSRAVVRGLQELGAEGMAHGTTIATNAILERTGARTVFVTTAGFEDLLIIGRQNRPNLYDFHITRPPPTVPPEMSVGARERIDAKGRTLRSLTEREVRRLAKEIRSRKAESVAICLLFSFARPKHERMIRDALADLPVSLSHEVLPEFREYERASTTVLDAYVKPLVVRYLADLKNSIQREFYVMKSGGGVASSEAVARRPVDLVLSGPAGGVAAAAALSSGGPHRNLVTFDMGGTSADFSALPAGEPTWRTDAVIDTFPIAVPVVDIESVGAGGGSVASIDSGSALHVGPESAGADPGPIAYGKGGTRVTVTDADLLAGYLGRSLLGRRLPLEESLSRKGLDHLARRLHLSLDETVLGVQSVVRATMAKAMRLVLARRGLDPKEYALLAFGGAGPMHAWVLARELGVRTVLVPSLPGAFSAYGILISPIRAEYSRSVVRPLKRSESILQSTIEGFRERALLELEAQGLDPRRARIEASADLRFRGQSYEINVPVHGDLANVFRREHRRLYGYASSREPIELVTIRLVARVPRRVSRPRPAKSSAAMVPQNRKALFEDGWQETPVLERKGLAHGTQVDGPAIVSEDHATTVVPPGGRLRVDRGGLLEIQVGR